MKLLFIYSLSFLFVNVGTDPDFAGVYKGEGCDISLELTHYKSGYHYHLMTKNRNEKGNVKVTKDQYSNGCFIELGSSKMDESNRKNKSNKIHFFLSNDTITMQNYGNVMNPYTQVNSCDDKYVVLVKGN